MLHNIHIDISIYTSVKKNLALTVRSSTWIKEIRASCEAKIQRKQNEMHETSWNPVEYGTWTGIYIYIYICYIINDYYEHLYTYTVYIYIYTSTCILVRIWSISAGGVGPWGLHLRFGRRKVKAAKASYLDGPKLYPKSFVVNMTAFTIHLASQPFFGSLAWKISENLALVQVIDWSKRIKSNLVLGSRFTVTTRTYWLIRRIQKTGFFALLDTFAGGISRRFFLLIHIFVQRLFMTPWSTVPSIGSMATLLVAVGVLESMRIVMLFWWYLAASSMWPWFVTREIPWNTSGFACLHFIMPLPENMSKTTWF